MSSPIVSESAACLLTRPGVAENSPLQAWDAADEYLISTLLDKHPSSLCILNDGFGALGCQLHKFNPLWVSDSVCAHNALQLNLEQNQLSPLTGCTTDNLPAEHYACVVIKARRGLTSLHQDLTLGLQLAAPNAEIYFAGMAKHIPPGTLDILREFGELDVLPTVKKARLYHLHNLKAATPVTPKITPIRDTEFAGFEGVFATQRLDEGTALLLNRLPTLTPDAHYADLCCGTGVIGLTLLQRGAVNVDFYDEYKPALNNTLFNLQKITHTVNTTCHWQDGMQHAEDDFYDAIFCNPPFHEQNVVGEHVAWRLFQDARKSLKKGGSLYVVCNRHLNYLPKLKQIYKSAQIISQHPKFMVIKADRA